jgi:hypothetical protein
MSPADEGQSEPEPVRRGREAMGRPVADLADPGRPWSLHLQCVGACRMQRRLVADLVPHVPPGLTWGEVVARLRCGRCGETADIVGLSGPPKMPGGGGTWLLLQRGKGHWQH